MPEDFRALIWSTPEVKPRQIMQKFEDRTALFIVFWNEASALGVNATPRGTTEERIHLDKNRTYYLLQRPITRTKST